MATPVLIDTDMGVDGAVAVSLALASTVIDVRAVVGVAGSVPLNQAVSNITRFLSELKPPLMPKVGLGLEQSGAGLKDRRDVYGHDGLGNWKQPVPASPSPEHFESVYDQFLKDAGDEAVIFALGPLTNIAAMIEGSPDRMKKIRRLVISGGVVWTKGNVGPQTEFNFHRDPVAASRVLASGLPMTVAPMDVTSLVCLDQSHVAHLAASGFRTGQLPAKLLEHAIEFDGEPAYGKIYIPAAVAVGSYLWQGLFMKTRMQLQVTPDGKDAGRSRPALAHDKSAQAEVLTAVNAVDLLENMLESLCHEAFVV